MFSRLVLSYDCYFVVLSCFGVGFSCYFFVGFFVCVIVKWECIDGNIRLENDSILKEIIVGL